MSGSSGGGGYPTINRPGGNDDCSSLVINANLASPDLDVLSNLNIGDILDIVTISDQGPLRALDSDGNIVGNILSREQIRLLSCIVKGVVFQAEIIALNEGQCTVQIRAI